MALEDWIQKGRELGASDLHLEAGTPLVARIRGELAAVGEPIPAQRIAQAAQELLGGEAWGVSSSSAARPTYRSQPEECGAG
jgi:twitching motility protein PilT